MTILSEKPATIQVAFPEPFHQGWSCLEGVMVEGNTLIIDPARYFFRYSNPRWIVCDWETVQAELLPVLETQITTIEQAALQFVKARGRVTCDPAEVLTVAWQVNTWMFHDDHLTEAGLIALGARAEHLRMLREVGTVMALNRVELTGEVSNVGPAWMFPVACKVIYGLNDAEARLVDELYHGTWFDEARRLAAIKANAALGGRLVHGCQSSADMRGGCVVPFGVDLAAFHRELRQFGDDWIERVEACGR